jgi:hypothetical protein
MKSPQPHKQTSICCLASPCLQGTYGALSLYKCVSYLLYERQKENERAWTVVKRFTGSPHHLLQFDARSGLRTLSSALVRVSGFLSTRYSDEERAAADKGLVPLRKKPLILDKTPLPLSSTTAMIADQRLGAAEVRIRERHRIEQLRKRVCAAAVPLVAPYEHQLLPNSMLRYLGSLCACIVCVDVLVPARNESAGRR